MSAEVKAAGPQREDREPEAVRAEAEKSSAENSEATSGESAEQKPELLSLDDLFDGTQGSSCSIDGICD